MLPGKGRVKAIIPRNASIPVLFMHLPLRTQRVPPGFFALLLFNSPAQEARSLDRRVNEYGRHRPLRLGPGAAGSPCPRHPGPGQSSCSLEHGHPTL